MEKPYLPLLLTIGFSALGVAGEYFLKVASQAEQPFKTAAFYIGFAASPCTARRHLAGCS